MKFVIIGQTETSHQMFVIPQYFVCFDLFQQEKNFFS